MAKSYLKSAVVTTSPDVNERYYMVWYVLKFRTLDACQNSADPDQTLKDQSLKSEE